MSTPLDRDGAALTAGALYAAFVEADWPGDPPQLIGYLYWTGTELVDEGGDPVDIDIDSLVRQWTHDPNPEMIDSSLVEAIAEARAEYHATGGDL